MSDVIETPLLRNLQEVFSAYRVTEPCGAGGNVKDGCHFASMGGTWMLFSAASASQWMGYR